MTLWMPVLGSRICCGKVRGGFEIGSLPTERFVDLWGLSVLLEVVGGRGWVEVFSSIR